MKPKNFIKLLTPPLLVQGYRFMCGRKQGICYGLSGNYRSWDEAMAASTGYDTQIILDKTRVALLKVKNGEAVYERDSVLFDEVQYSWPLLAGLLWIAAQSDGKISVLDFGGSLGSTYFQNRVFLRRLKKVEWNIIEQSLHVKTGKESFEDDNLRFYPKIKACLAEKQPNVIILSSVLQYLECPYDILNELLSLPIDHIVLDRTPFWNGSKDRLCVQNVPPDIYAASYPSWIFSRQRFLSQVNSLGFEIVAEFESLDRLKGPVEFSYKGMIVTRSVVQE